ncbi:MAG: DUF1934 domain-containing protein [Ruminococcaceae bacterium]|jgi:uncharacterized beta-barrel protein YwiB (DUF1934 family)|nr:DUF1934 domain-containing protein [Oscillospiraceae bacterium]
MEPNVLLTIKGQQWSGKEKPQEILLTTEGHLYRKAQAWHVVYQESSATGMDGTQTTMQVFDDGSIVLSRSGTHEMRLTFQAGNRHITRMNTPYGDLDVAVYTSLVDSSINDQGGYIQLGYSIDFNNSEHVNTRLDVKIRQRGV